jgi:hypothetical protein
MAGTGPAPDTSAIVERHIEAIERTLADRGPTHRDALARLVGARYWGPGGFRFALDEAVREGRARRLRRGVVAPVRAGAGGGTQTWPATPAAGAGADPRTSGR